MFQKSFEYSFITLITLLTFSSTFGNYENLGKTKKNCSTTDVQAFCSDCETFVLCSNAEPLPTACPPGEVCQEIGTFSTCTDSYVEGCECPLSGYIEFQDLYDDSKYVICDEGERHIETCDSNEIFDNDSGTCESPLTTPSPTTAEPPKCPDYSPANVSVSCTQYQTCYSDSYTDVKTCPLGSIFSNDTTTCVPYVPFSCDNKTDGFHGDTHNCSIYYLCINGEINGNSLPCPDGDLFDETAGTCVPEAESNCKPIVDCGICKNDGYIKIDCYNYYKCEENEDPDSDLPYVPVIKYCPAGTCFSQNTTFCDLDSQSI